MKKQFLLILSLFSVALSAQESENPWLRAMDGSGGKYEFEPSADVVILPAVSTDGVASLTVRQTGADLFTGARAIETFIPTEEPNSVEHVATTQVVPFYVAGRTIMATDQAISAAMRIYSVQGIEMTRASGNLPQGVYIVIIHNQPFKTLIP